jgi:predicted  nucleic acid-binding Zn-ribbon protein
VAENINARVDRLEEVLVLLAEEQVKTEQHFRETDRRIEETQRLLRESGERLDARIDKLVSAIGEFIRISGNR